MLVAARDLMVRQAHHEVRSGACAPLRLILSLSKDEARQARCSSRPAISWFDGLTMRVAGCGGVSVEGASAPLRLILSLSKGEARRARCWWRPAISWFDRLTMRVAEDAMIPKRLILSLSKDEARQARCSSRPAISGLDGFAMSWAGRTYRPEQTKTAPPFGSAVFARPAPRKLVRSRGLEPPQRLSY